ncbi:Glutamine amidotransferase class-II [Pseudonocardia sp. Ae168_Ps1]|uniref:ergothioneine biosynthesis protein EgtC n=1 Tax=unclassified Pseudonocardia TaxID=2619320 RepID=UPI00094B6FB2|nr:MULTISPECIES: ergothioneine biosynthesis protein EgtC [unclassified Pseudonocardia]OLL72466.1 Glutamine amidotransferase class-II [Pseudonocardia sp. Ae150A_Ps1]OLL78438.1 Glutamine amidotransferase class-II [Pseudonocardia sp. Ae168_Ps1]OLL87436.1 Glutamine amidotransferase class-II [Pseudonocardia sp. Ae263_Ps1]OLL92535.1 Glutamine amidotransferase class-II [Pseudonocardia sp. Ae356_Ps1]
MCRHLAHLGPPRTLASILLEPEHGLLAQSYAPADMRGGGTINADGYGAGWYPASGAAPVRVRSASPLWADPSFAALAGATSSGAVLAAIRSATVGMPVVETAAAPFTDGRWLFSHNGVVRGWPGSLVKAASGLPAEDLMPLDAPTDSAVLWALVRRRLAAGDDPGTVLAETCELVERDAPDSRLNLLLTDGGTVWATAWRHALAVRSTPDATTVASEPTHAFPDWTQVPDRHLVVARPGHHELHPVTPDR